MPGAGSRGHARVDEREPCRVAQADRDTPAAEDGDRAGPRADRDDPSGGPVGERRRRGGAGGRGQLGHGSRPAAGGRGGGEKHGESGGGRSPAALARAGH